MRKLRVGDVLTKARHPITVDDDTKYRQVTVRLKHQGVCLRGYKIGKEIGTKKQSSVRSGQFILSKIDARNGAFGIIPDDLDGAIVTNDFLTYDVNEKELNIELFRLLTSQATFDELCNKASTGTTNRKRLNEKMFLDQEIILPPIEEQDAFIAHFKKLQSAQEKTLAELQIQSDLIAKLRNSILSDAVCGRLVPQGPADEPASLLLERIKAEKEKLVKEGKIKKQKLLSPILEDEIPYELPNGWVWCRLGEISSYIQRGKGPKYTEYSTHRVISQKCVRWHGLDLNPARYIEVSSLEKYEDIRFLKSSDLLWNSTGTGTIGRACLVPTELERLELVADSHVTVVRSMLIDANYLWRWIQSPFVQNQIEGSASGTTNQIELNTSTIVEHLIPLPPIAEQHRIIAKVGNLMTTCDALEAEVQKSRTETDRLMETILKEAFKNKKEDITEAKAPKAFQRSVLAAYLIDNSQDDPYFGHVKLQKMLFMCETVNNLDFDSDYKRHAMGPYDPKLIRSVDAQLKKAKWFEVKKSEGDKGRYVYHPMAKAEEYKKYLGRYWDQNKIEKIFELMHPMKTQQAEIVATLYSAWTDLNKTHMTVSDEILINEARNNWHDNKKTIPVEKWQHAIEWMRNKGLF